MKEQKTDQWNRTQNSETDPYKFSHVPFFEKGTKVKEKTQSFQQMS